MFNHGRMFKRLRWAKQARSRMFGRAAIPLFVLTSEAIPGIPNRPEIYAACKDL